MCSSGGLFFSILTVPVSLSLQICSDECYIFVRILQRWRLSSLDEEFLSLYSPCWIRLNSIFRLFIYSFIEERSCLTSVNQNILWVSAVHHAKYKRFQSYLVGVSFYNITKVTLKYADGRKLSARKYYDFYIMIIHRGDSLFMLTSSNGNIFRVNGHLCGEFTGHRWIPHTKVSGADLWCFLSSVPE